MTDKVWGDSIYDDITEVQLEMADIIRKLIDAEWDSNTLKQNLEKLSKQHTQIQTEIFKLEDKDKCTCGHTRECHDSNQACTFQYPLDSDADFKDNQGICVCVEFDIVKDEK